MTPTYNSNYKIRSSSLRLFIKEKRKKIPLPTQRQLLALPPRPLPQLPPRPPSLTKKTTAATATATTATTATTTRKEKK